MESLDAEKSNQATQKDFVMSKMRAVLDKNNELAVKLFFIF